MGIEVSSGQENGDQKPQHVFEDINEIVSRIKALGLPAGEYVVFGSGPLLAAGIRGVSDIDLLVSTKTLELLRQKGWQPVQKGPGDTPLAHDIFEAHDKWNFSSYQPTLEQLLESATMVDGVPFASLEEVRKWKAAAGRPKDLVDIGLIDKHQNLAQT